MLLQVENVRKSFGPLEVLKGVSLPVDRGDVVAILGPSGSGKTTLLRCVNFLERADGGTLTFDGERFGLELVLDNSHLPQAISTLARQSWWRKDKSKTVDVNLWFRPAVPEEREWYPAGENRNLTVAMAGDRPAGILAASRAGVDGAGQIEYLTIFPEHRGRNLGVQLIGQAVSVFRKSGLDRIVLPCPAEEARGYFRQFGFTETGEGLGRMEKYIGLDQ